MLVVVELLNTTAELPRLSECASMATALKIKTTFTTHQFKMSTRTEKFQRKPAEKKDDPLPRDDDAEIVKFSPEEEAVSRSESCQQIRPLITLLINLVSSLRIKRPEDSG